MILIIDGQNFMHRARSGFQLGDHNIVFNLFRNLRALVEQFQPTRVYFTLEGHPRKRLQLLPEYKANREVDASTEAGAKKQKVLEDFFRQARLIVQLLEGRFPVSVVRQPDHEADDLIHNIVKNSARCIDIVVASSDSDFTQLLQAFDNVRVYNPIAKSFVSAPEGYDYVFWKALRGDGTDNVPKIPGVTDDKAEELLGDPDALRELFKEHGSAFNRNVDLIRFMDFDEQELLAVECSAPVRDWDAVRSVFLAYSFQSILKEPYWSRFQATFDRLWPGSQGETAPPAVVG